MFRLEARASLYLSISSETTRGLQVLLLAPDKAGIAADDFRPERVGRLLTAVRLRMRVSRRPGLDCARFAGKGSGLGAIAGAELFVDSP
jgi:hypothetical protein